MSLRPPSERDLASIDLGIHDADVVRWLGRPEASAVEVLALNRRRWANGSPTFAICEHDDLCVGLVWVNVDATDASIGSIGYWLLPGARGRGLATTAVRLLSVWAARELGVTHLRLFTDPENERSQQVALRSGYRLIGIQAGKGHVDGRRADQVLFELPSADG